MNRLLVGTDKSQLLHDLPEHYLVIDDGPFIDALADARAHPFNPRKHSFNPLSDMDYRKACDLVDVLDAAFPAGESTLTKANGLFHVLETLTGKTVPTRLDKLVHKPDAKEKDTGVIWAYQKVRRLLMSPVLRRVLNTSMTFPFDVSVTAKLDRSRIGDFDAYVLGNLLISQFQGAIVLPDFGFYAAPFHTSLIRQGRLIAGLNSFSEVSEQMRNQLLLIDDKEASRCTREDAETLASYLCPALRNTDKYADFIAERMA